MKRWVVPVALLVLAITLFICRPRANTAPPESNALGIYDCGSLGAVTVCKVYDPSYAGHGWVAYSNNGGVALYR